MTHGKVLCVVGPTAVGKSEIAERVALTLDGEVVSVDSMQVYCGMDIGTAKTKASERRCPLHMVDVAQISQPYSVSQFQDDARACIDGLVAKNKTPVLCGGTGLYLDAVIDNMEFPHGETGSERRKEYERIASQKGAEALHAILSERDSASANEIHPRNVRRVVRALEMLDEGVSYAQTHQGLHKRTPYYESVIWALVLPRTELYARIDARVDHMVECGLVDEVARLRDEGLEGTLTAAKAIGYKEVLGALRGELTLFEATELIKRNSRRYAKRQLSWIRRDGRARYIDMSEVTASEATELICEDWGTK